MYVFMFKGGFVNKKEHFDTKGIFVSGEET